MILLALELLFLHGIIVLLHGIREQGCSSSINLRSYMFSLSEGIQSPISLWRRACIELTRFYPSFYLCRLPKVSSWAHQHINMESSSAMILTPFNYHEWKSKIGILFCNKRLYKVTLPLENEPNAIVEKYKWHNRLDEGYGFVCL